MVLKISKVTDKVEKLDVKGQGCSDDCWTPVFIGNQSVVNGCRVEYGWSAQFTTWW